MQALWTIDEIAQRIADRKAARSRELAALPFAKKIEIVERLRQISRATKKFRTKAQTAHR